VIASIESQLGGQAEFNWRSEGLICRLSVPLTPDDVAARQLSPRPSLAVAGNRLS
jgi:hypothetical protein